jgi:hypothetical protein
MPTPSLARDFYDQFLAAPDRLAFLRSLIHSTPPTYETDWLDFKGQPNPDLKHPKWREMWCEALVGFANNGGGVLVWGIDARKDKDTNVDAASAEVPVDNPAGVKSRLQELHRGAVDPPLLNVEIECVDIPGSGGKGFVVCFVPEGSFKPYRTEQGRSSQFLIRSGDSFYVMGRPIIQTMFYPRTRPLFRVVASLEFALTRRDSRPVAAMACEARIVNEGNATAKDAFVVVGAVVEKSSEAIRYTTPNWAWETATVGTEREFRSHRPLHPNRFSPLFKAEWEVETRLLHSDNSRMVPYCHNPEFALLVFCEHQERQVITLNFDMEELVIAGSCIRDVKAAE